MRDGAAPGAEGAGRGRASACGPVVGRPRRGRRSRRVGDSSPKNGRATKGRNDLRTTVRARNAEGGRGGILLSCCPEVLLSTGRSAGSASPNKRPALFIPCGVAPSLRPPPRGGCRAKRGWGSTPCGTGRRRASGGAGRAVHGVLPPALRATPLSEGGGPGAGGGRPGFRVFGRRRKAPPVSDFCGGFSCGGGAAAGRVFAKSRTSAGTPARRKTGATTRKPDNPKTRRSPPPCGTARPTSRGFRP